ncbi:MAG: hypothetical protein WAZ75_03290 [Candidatus Absconditicoccaceae bacterium]
MKKSFVIIIAIIAISVSSFAQITGIIVTKDSSVVIDRIYAGSLSGTMLHTDSLYADGFTGVRFGAMATYKPASWISFSSWAMVQVDGGSTPWSLQQFYMTVQPSKKFTVQIGSMASIPTEQRPHPVSGNGQFETWSEASIPGGGLGVKVKYQFTSSFQLAGGVVVRKGLPEYSGRITYKKVQLSAWHSVCDTTTGAALTVDFSRVYSTFVFKQDQTIADVLVIKISKKHDLSFYSDMGYSFVKKELVRGEVGVLKGFDSKWVDGLIGLGYQHESKSVAAYLFVHL